MSEQQSEIVAFKLINTHVTSYMREDGTGVDAPEQYRIMPTFTIYNDDKPKPKPIRVRHIRSATSIFLEEQMQNNEDFNTTNDNLWFLNGLILLDTHKDSNAIEVLRISPQNVATPDSKKIGNVEPIFIEVQREKEGTSEIDKIFLQDKAVALVMKLQEKKDEGYVYNENRLNFYANIFKLDGDLAPSEKVLTLRKKAIEDPTSFMYRVNTETDRFELDIKKAIELKVIDFVKDNLIFTQSKQVIKTFENLVKGDEIKMLTEFFSTPLNEDSYEMMKALTGEAIEASVKQKTVEK